MNQQPTIFHITHQKAGSKWVAAVLHDCASDRYVMPKIKGNHFKKSPIKLGGIYSNVYLSKPNFEKLLGVNLWGNPKNLFFPNTYISNWYNFQMRQQPYRKFVIIRDLRDTLISAYFSFKISHELLTKELGEWRYQLNNMDQEQGFIYLMDEVIKRLADIQSSWLNDEGLLIKYENLIADQYKIFNKIIRYCQIDISDQDLQEIIKRHSFESVTQRKRGQENINSHQRKAIAGDWKNFFSENIKKEFKHRFGNLLIQAGYENDLNW